MKRILICFFLFSFSVFADEVESLETLIRLTRQQLDKQEALLGTLKAFQTTKEAFLASDDDPVLGTKLVYKAMQLHELIDKAHLAHLFSQEFLEEIAFFNDMGQIHHLKK